MRYHSNFLLTLSIVGLLVPATSFACTCSASDDCGSCGGGEITCNENVPAPCGCNCVDGGCSSCGSCTRTCNGGKTTNYIRCYDKMNCGGPPGVDVALMPRMRCGKTGELKLPFIKSRDSLSQLLRPVSWQVTQEAEPSVQVPEGIPLALSDLQLNPISGNVTFDGLKFILRNGSSHALVAYELWWDLYLDNGTTMRLPSTSDSWLRGQLLSTGEETSLSYNVRTANGPKVLQVIGTVAYAEFDDGTRLGPDATAMTRYFAQSRIRALDIYSKLFQIYQTQGVEGIDHIFSNPIALPQDENYRWAWTRLMEVYKEKGLGGVMNEIRTRLDHRGSA